MNKQKVDRSRRKENIVISAVMIAETGKGPKSLIIATPANKKPKAMVCQALLFAMAVVTRKE